MNDKPLALVYTMGKVGSSTLMNAVRSVGYNPGRGYPENIESLRPLEQWEKVITAVRDPVARNASYFFENWPVFFDEEPVEYGDYMIDLFLEKVAHVEPIYWFNYWLNADFGISVMDQTFSRKKGWQVYDGNLLLIRTESIMKGLQNAFVELFELPEDTTVSVEHRAETALTRPYAKAYQEFVKNLRLPEYLLKTIYDSEFMEHFYYKKEIAEFRKRWS